jgi:hypothetical protein
LALKNSTPPHFSGENIMKFKIALSALSVMLGVNALADPVYQPPGPNLTYGSSSNNQSIMSSIANPAAAAAVLGMEDSQYRFGILNIGAGYEIGNVNNLFDKIDSTKTQLTSASIFTLAGLTTGQQVADYVNSNIISNVNSLTSTLQKDGNASIYFDGHIPLTPFVVTRKGLGGSIVLDANASAIANISFIADPLAQLTATDGQNILNAASGGNGTYTPPANDSTLLVKAAVVGEVGFGYSRSIFRREAPEPIEGEPTPGAFSASQLQAGDMTAGVRVKYYEVKLARDAQNQTSSSAGGAQSTLKASQTYTSSTGVGLDLGTLWTSKRYRLGAWVNNINSPSFKYNTIDTSTYWTQPAVIAQINADGTYKMKPQLEMEGALYSESQNWVLNGTLDGNAVQDPVGRDFQWATLSAAYATNSWWIPGARVGYRTNLAGSKLSYVTAGLTMFKALSLDVAYGLDSIDYQGKSYPRSAMINLGLQMTF